MRSARLALLHDALMAALSFWAALYLRWGPNFIDYTREYLFSGTLLFAFIAVSALLIFRSHQGLWRYASLRDLIALAKSATAAVVLFYALLFVLTRLEGLPRSVPMIQWMVLMLLWGVPRVLYRLAKDGRVVLAEGEAPVKTVPVLLYGATDNAELFLRELQRDGAPNYRVVGIVDDRPEHQGRKMQGVTIFGHIDSLPRIIEKLTLRGKRPQRLILAEDDVQGAAMQSLLARAEAHGMGLARLPRMSALRSGAADRASVRPIAIEDLLGRAQTPQDPAAMRALIAGKRVLVTGAGGTIGGELCRQIAGYAPAELTLLDQGEFQLYGIDHELAQAHAEIPRRALLGDIRDAHGIEEIFARAKPQLVFHAAAIKHVPIAEENPEVTLLTNVTGTRVVAEACQRHGAEAMVLISTDKAVNPSSIMGATKRLAESLCQALGRRGATKFVTVRFGNVLGSTGSVVPLFQKQLEAGGPLTVTHKDMVRYFMTVREAVGLVLLAARQGLDETEPPIYVLDMGEPVRIEELALQMIRLAGLRPHRDVQIRYTGLRKGEKLFEELFHSGEPLTPTPRAGILQARPREVAADVLLPALDKLSLTAAKRDTQALLEDLQKLVPEFQQTRFGVVEKQEELRN